MKKERVLAGIITSIMVCGLCGCGASTKYEITSTDSASIEATEYSAADVSAEASDNTESSSQMTSEEASSEASIDLTSLSDDEFIYKGKRISILSDAQTSLDSLGEATHKVEGAGDMIYYEYGTYNQNEQTGVSFITYMKDGKEMPAQFDINVEGVTTSKGIGPGSSKDDIISAYGEPDETMVGGAALIYNKEDYQLNFLLDANEKVTNFGYQTMEYINRDM